LSRRGLWLEDDSFCAFRHSRATKDGLFSRQPSGGVSGTEAGTRKRSDERRRRTTRRKKRKKLKKIEEWWSKGAAALDFPPIFLPLSSSF
jgi:hypothetical protein